MARIHSPKRFRRMYPRTSVVGMGPLNQLTEKFSVSKLTKLKPKTTAKMAA